ncbi:hypothetical protein [Bradyrhizobium sp.]|uniref:hypothetical protein n=1 Tax=Bradyrhizobium sp. TaxID=376 RepID=UPI003C5F2CA0
MRTLFVLLAVLFAVPQIKAEPAGKLPSFDIDRNCSSEASAGTNVQLTKTECVRDEVDARKRLDQQWSRLGSHVRRECVGESTIGGDQSYVELLTCLQMSSEWTGSQTVGQAPADASHH